MITIKGKKHPIYLPGSWEDLTPAWYLYTIERLLLLVAGQITPVDLRVSLMLRYTGYRPRRWRLFPDDPERRAIINHNLVLLSGLIEFPLRGAEINTRFHRNPLPFVKIGRRRYAGKRFDTGIVIRTDITAREFSDAFDLVKAYAASGREECLDSLCAILYPAIPGNPRANALSGHERRFARVPFLTRYAILVWFTGIARYFMDHPDYKVLFSDTTASRLDRPDRVDLGLSEIIMHLSLDGFGSKEEMERSTIVEFFDMQVKSLKKKIAAALASGLKEHDIASRAGIHYSVIQRLS
ncbi:MAG: hypothetical protein LBP56_05195 [Odoribacteraceae bacterium]|jgi:hypothetical protein|nr:hypothetical protein [Odoribacteraceae bacterium]